MYYWEEDKEIARLRWEYLLRSEEYKKFCIQHRMREDRNDITVVASMADTAHGSLFLQFGDIHSKSFDDYWKGEVGKRAIIKKWNDILAMRGFNWKVREYNIGEDIDDVISQYEKYAGTGKKPSIEELKEGLIQSHNGFIVHDWRTYLMIRTGNTIRDVNEATKEIGKLLKKRIPKKRFVKEELERYLRVYIMRTNTPPVPFRDIHKKEFPKDKDYTDNHRRARISDYNRAKKIINNIQNNMQFWW